MSFASPLDQVHKESYDDLYFMGVVTDDNDPDKLERVRVRIEGQHDEIADADLPWAAPMKFRGHGSMGGTVGVGGMIPMKGAHVFVVFMRGDQHYPLYVGGVLQPSLLMGLFKENYPFRYGWVDRAGNKFWVDSKSGTVEFHLFHAASGSNLNLDNDGNLVGYVSGNARMRIDKNFDLDVGQTYTVKAATIVMEASGSISTRSGTTTSIQAGSNLNTTSGDKTNMFAASNFTATAANQLYCIDRDGTFSPPR